MNAKLNTTNLALALALSIACAISSALALPLAHPWLSLSAGTPLSPPCWCALTIATQFVLVFQKAHYVSIV